MITTQYKIPSPSSGKEMIEVYGDGEMAWYEYRIISEGKVLKDTGREGGHGRQYGQPEIALRDALMFVTDMTPE